MSKVMIADITTLTDDDRLYGHFAKVAQQYYEILSERFEVKIGGGKTYRRYFSEDQLIVFPYHISVKDDHSGLKGRAIRKYKEFCNAWYALHSEADIVIFQCLNETPVYLCLLFYHRSKVCMIQYQKGLNSRIKKFIFRIVRSHINGFIVSSQAVADLYKGDPIILPDYFPLSHACPKKQAICYDAVVLGTINEWKDHDEVIRCFNDTGFKILIAGKFQDIRAFDRLMGKKARNIEIIDRYLSEDEYEGILLSSRYVLLPYRKEYMDKSSGVLLEALYNEKPVIAPRINTFQCAIDADCGLFYKDHISEILDDMQDEKRYLELKENTKRFVSDMELKKRGLICFIERLIGL